MLIGTVAPVATQAKWSFLCFFSHLQPSCPDDVPERDDTRRQSESTVAVFSHFVACIVSNSNYVALVYC